MYSSKPLFPYARNYVLILPLSMSNIDLAGGSIVKSDDYAIYFKPETPENVKTRFIEDYAQYHKKLKENNTF